MSSWQENEKIQRKELEDRLNELNNYDITKLQRVDDE